MLRGVEIGADNMQPNQQLTKVPSRRVNKNPHTSCLRCHKRPARGWDVGGAFFCNIECFAGYVAWLQKVLEQQRQECIAFQRALRADWD